MAHLTMMKIVMTDFENTILKAMEEAAISGLCREGQLEIGVQTARKLRPDLGDEALTAWVRSLNPLGSTV